ncbi:MAG: phosphatidylserine synthase, partial [Lachnospiraceae bacterium]|nr:phosphatidylserine synthase [Lachnospiraceae bacterium]
RLAWFNVDEEERQDEQTGGRETYLGLPVTTSALLLPLFIGTAQLLSLPVGALSPWLLCGIAIAFIAPFHLKKPKALGKIIMLLLGAAALAVVIIGVKM